MYVHFNDTRHRWTEDREVDKTDRAILNETKNLWVNCARQKNLLEKASVVTVCSLQNNLHGKKVTFVEVRVEERHTPALFCMHCESFSAPPTTITCVKRTESEYFEQTKPSAMDKRAERTMNAP